MKGTLTHTSHYMQKINSKQMRDLDVKPQNYKTPKENIGENDYDFKFSKGFTATNTKKRHHTI